jgi:hypothetical protein
MKIKKFALFITLLLVQNMSFAFTAIKPALVRDEKFNAVIKNVELANLTSEDSYVGENFRILKGKTDEVVRFDDSEELQLKAATTYYHLTKARNFFVLNLKSEYVKSLPIINIRLDITNVFNEVGHFGNDKLDPQYNNALSIPKGPGYAPANIPGWDLEIWFRPSKEIHIRDLDLNSGIGPTVKSSLNAFRNQTHMTNFKDFFISILSAGVTNINSTSIVNNMMRFGQSSVVIEFLYQTTDIAAEFFQRKIYRLDTAMVPEIIYHEFSHIALSDRLELTHSTPVNEGMADYFAGKISGSKELATHINDYNLFSGKKVQNKQLYNLAFERGEFANTDFVFGLLWNLGNTVGPDIEANFVNEMAKRLTTDANIRDDLIKASIDTCTMFCKSPLNDRIKLYKFYNQKGL